MRSSPQTLRPVGEHTQVDLWLFTCGLARGIYRSGRSQCRNLLFLEKDRKQWVALLMSHYRPRERRIPVSIKARLKSDIGWGDTRICNVSSRGMMVKYSPPPPLGSYVEICRGEFSVVGRVRWIATDCFGLRALECIDIGQLENPRKVVIPMPGDRRRWPRHAPIRPARQPDLHEQAAAARKLRRRLEFLVIAGVGAMTALALVSAMASAFAAPLSDVRLTLQGVR